MTKKEFVNAFAEKGELKIKDSERLVNAFLGTIEDALLKGDGVRFIGFGSWEVKERSAREVKNPQTGKMIKVEAKKVVKFKVGKPLADKVAAGKHAKKATKKKEELNVFKIKGFKVINNIKSFYFYLYFITL